MSQETARLGIPKKSEFVNQTAASGKWINPSRGSGMNQIDRTLELWETQCHSPYASTVSKLQCISSVINACQAWKHKKAGKATPLSIQRRQVIESTERKATQAFEYMKNKFKSEQRPHAPNAKPHRGAVKHMEPGYAHERAHYVQQNKQNHPYSASNVVEHLGHGANVDQMDLNQFTTTASNNQLLRVEFFNRAQRVQYLIIVENGLLYRDGQPMDNVSGNTVMADTYVVDRYGNLYSKPFQYNANLYFNHSSYCAGKEILCAGTIACENGQLVYISNLSGHYKPNSGYLLQYLQMLNTEGVSFNDVLVDSMELAKSMQAQTFMANSQAAEDWPHWYQQGNNRQPTVCGGKRISNPG